jgi:hypothetical protein
MLTRDEIKGCSDIRTERVPTPEWAPLGKLPEDCYVFVRGLSAEENDQFEEAMIQAKRKGAKVTLKDTRAKLAVLACVDDQGHPLFDDHDVAWLTKKSAAPLNRIFKKAQELAGMTDADLEELEENLKKIPAGDSTSA